MYLKIPPVNLTKTKKPHLRVIEESYNMTGDALE